MESTVVIAGGSGLLGRALAASLAGDGHRVLTLTRRPRPEAATDIAWLPDGSTGPWARALDGAAAIVNLAGEGIADRRWTPARKAALRASRLASTRSLVAAIRHTAVPPRVFACGSAIGYYGPRDDDEVVEATPPGTDFLARLCADWEAEAARAGDATRVAMLRTGVVLDRSGGALGRMLPPFRLGLGAALGSGRQFMSWIHIDDWCSMAAWIIGRESAGGPFNLTAPVPATNAAFTQAMARALHRPALLRVPAPLLRLGLGELAGVLVEGARVLPSRASAAGFGFRFPEIDLALADLLRRP